MSLAAHQFRCVELEFRMFVVAGTVKKVKTNAQNSKLDKSKLMHYQGQKIRTI